MKKALALAFFLLLFFSLGAGAIYCEKRLSRVYCDNQVVTQNFVAVQDPFFDGEVTQDVHFFQSILAGEISAADPNGVYHFAVVDKTYAVWVVKSGGLIAFYSRRIFPSFGTTSQLTPAFYSRVYPIFRGLVKGGDHTYYTAQPPCVGSSGRGCYEGTLAFATVVGDKFVYAAASGAGGVYYVNNLASPAANPNTVPWLSPSCGALPCTYEKVMPPRHAIVGGASFSFFTTEAPNCLGSAARGCDEKAVAFVTILDDKFFYAANTQPQYYLRYLSSPSTGYELTPQNLYAAEVDPPTRVISGGVTLNGVVPSGCIGNYAGCETAKIDFVTISGDSFVYVARSDPPNISYVSINKVILDNLFRQEIETTSRICASALEAPCSTCTFADYYIHSLSVEGSIIKYFKKERNTACPPVALQEPSDLCCSDTEPGCSPIIRLDDVCQDMDVQADFEWGSPPGNTSYQLGVEIPYKVTLQSDNQFTFNKPVDIIVLFDKSGSMTATDEFSAARDALNNQFIQYFQDLGSIASSFRIGVVPFDETAVSFPLTEQENLESVKDYVDSLSPSDPAVWTSIGSGLGEAAKMVEYDYCAEEEVSYIAIVIFTDGEENKRPYYNEVFVPDRVHVFGIQFPGPGVWPNKLPAIAANVGVADGVIINKGTDYAQAFLEAAEEIYGRYMIEQLNIQAKLNPNVELVSADPAESSGPDPLLWNIGPQESTSYELELVLKPNVVGDYPLFVGSDSFISWNTPCDNYQIPLENPVLTITGPNMPPTADAGDDQSVPPSSAVSLDGSRSSDPEDCDSGDPLGTCLTYFWSCDPASPSPCPALNDAANFKPTFTAGAAGEAYVYRLDVTDSGGLSDPDGDTVQVLVVAGANMPPTADAGGPYSTILPATAIELDGTASTDEKDCPFGGDCSLKMSYDWRITSNGANCFPVSGSGARLSIDCDTPRTSTVMLTVTNSGGLSDTDTATITVIAPAGPFFKILSFRAEPLAPNVGENFASIDVTVKNIGNAAGTPQVKLDVLHAVLPDELFLSSGRLPCTTGEIGPGGICSSFDFSSFDISSLGTGTYKLRASAFRQGVETADDTADLYFTVGKAAAVPELHPLLLVLVLAAALLVLWRKR